MNITIQSTIYAVYKKCRNESVERSFIKAYPSLEQAKKAVRKTIFQLTDALMTTRNVITDHSTAGGGGEQYKVITTPKNSINPYHRLECIMYIQPYSLPKDESENESESEENVSTAGFGTTERKETVVEEERVRENDSVEITFQLAPFSDAYMKQRSSNEQPLVVATEELSEVDSSVNSSVNSVQLDEAPAPKEEEEKEEETDDEEVEHVDVSSLGHYLNGFGISSFGIGRN